MLKNISIGTLIALGIVATPVWTIDRINTAVVECVKKEAFESVKQDVSTIKNVQSKDHDAIIKIAAKMGVELK